MAITEKETLNKTQNQELKLPCSQCAGKTVHKVLASVDKDGEEIGNNWSIHWNENHQIVQCAGCKTNSFRSDSSNSEESFQIGEDEWKYIDNEKLYPPRIEGRKDLGNAVHYLPSKIKTIYNETLQALNGNSPVLTGIGLRALIETVCKENKAIGNDLFNKIDDLVTKELLTPVGAITLHKIRTLGNKAAHEVEPHSEKQLSLALDIAEHLLEDIYIIPKKIVEEFI